MLGWRKLVAEREAGCCWETYAQATLWYLLNFALDECITLQNEYMK